MNKKIGKNDKVTVRSKAEKSDNIATKRPYGLWNQIDRLFDDFHSEFNDLFWPRRHRHGGSLESYHPMKPALLDLEDKGDSYELTVDIPGASKEDLNIEITPTNIKISAEQEDESEDQGKNWMYKERSNMQFYRTVEFPEKIKSDNVEAELNNGVLTVNLPKIEPKPEYRPKKVTVK
jgi:HSP20 family protein